MTAFDPRYSPHPLMCVFILLLDSAVGLYRLLRALPEFVFDYILQALFGSYLPTSIDGLINCETYNKICYERIGKLAIKVERAKQKEQHANSTSRAWLRVRYEGDSEDTLVFAKCQAINFFVRVIMSLFNVYRNEMLAYDTIEFPIPTSKVHGAKYTRSRFVLVLEDLSARQVEFPNIWSKHVDYDLGTRVLTALAKIHAKYWNACPSGVWNEENRPYQGLGMGMFTLWRVDRICKPNLIPSDMHAVFMQALWHWVEFRDYLSKSQPKTLCHGDTHMGNFYIEKDGTIGAIDFQVLSEENPLRDVAYFLSSSYDPDLLENHEQDLIRFYLAKLVELGVPKNEVPTFDEAFYAYRLQLFYALYAFVFSGGFANLMDHVQTDCGVERIIRTMRRVDSTGALYEMLEGRIQ